MLAFKTYNLCIHIAAIYSPQMMMLYYCQFYQKIPQTSTRQSGGHLLLHLTWIELLDSCQFDRTQIETCCTRFGVGLCLDQGTDCQPKSSCR